MLLPALASAKEKARRTACYNNSKQLCLAMLMYVDDNDSHYPPRMPDPDAGPAYPCKPCRTIDWRPYAISFLGGSSKVVAGTTNITLTGGVTNVFICPSDKGVPADIAADPMNQASPRPKRMADFYGSSYCLNTVVTRLGAEGAIVNPSETYMGAEIWSWHPPQQMAVGNFKTKTTKPVRVTFFCDGHTAIASEIAIAEQCTPPAAPGIGPVP
ncbi:MAG: DUF1559 domain-containing protein, partial [Verrucomicrobiota bacterium]